jgi:hypothetical protein
MDSYFDTQWVPNITLIIASIARDDDYVSIHKNCKDGSAENATAPSLPCPDAAMCGTRIEKKKDVRARKDDGIEAGPLFF